MRTESWKSAFREIVPAGILAECTELEPARAMYRRLLSDVLSAMCYLLELDRKRALHRMVEQVRRDEDMAGCAELICIHSLLGKLAQGPRKRYDGATLADVKEAGYETLVLWVIEKHTSAIRFCESFCALRRVE